MRHTHTQGGQGYLFDDDRTGDARTQSPTTKNCASKPPTLGEIAGFNWAKCNAQSPPRGTAFLITVSPMPGKLTASSHWALYIPQQGNKRLWVWGWNVRHLHSRYLMTNTLQCVVSSWNVRNSHISILYLRQLVRSYTFKKACDKASLCVIAVCLYLSNNDQSALSKEGEKMSPGEGVKSVGKGESYKQQGYCITKNCLS